LTKTKTFAEGSRELPGSVASLWMLEPSSLLNLEKAPTKNLCVEKWAKSRQSRLRGKVWEGRGSRLL